MNLEYEKEGGLRHTKNKREYDYRLPVISVITVVFNGEDTIEQTIKSVISQTYKNLEYIIIDGGSTDGTLNIIRQHEHRIDSWLSEPDKGIYDAMNKGIDLASGTWINFMNSGDRFASTDTINSFVAQASDADVIYGDALIQYPGFATRYKTHPLHQMWRRSPFCHQAAFVKASLVRELKFDLSYKLGADYDFFFRAYKARKRFLYLNAVICVFEGHTGASKTHFILAMKELFRSSLTHEFKLSRWVFSKLYMAYVQVLVLIKKVLGDRVVLWSKKTIQQIKS